MNLDGLEKLVDLVPQTFGEAIQIYPWIKEICEPHEYDNRTTLENAAFLIKELKKRINNYNKTSAKGTP